MLWRAPGVIFALFFTLFSSSVPAGVIIGGTRVIYYSDKSDATITVKNNEKALPYLIQAWVDPFDKDVTQKNVFYGNSTRFPSGRWTGKGFAYYEGQR